MKRVSPYKRVKEKYLVLLERNALLEKVAEAARNFYTGVPVSRERLEKELGIALRGLGR